MTKNIVLLGFMGTGKSSVGKILGKKLGRPVADVDEAIEAGEKRKIHEIFEKNGEARFRALEKEAIRELSGRNGAVITTGGGAVLDLENIEALRRNGILITLLASPETIHHRVKDSRRRPLLSGTDLKTKIRELWVAREPLYRQADHFFETDGKRPAEVADEIVAALRLAGEI